APGGADPEPQPAPAPAHTPKAPIASAPAVEPKADGPRFEPAGRVITVAAALTALAAGRGAGPRVVTAAALVTATVVVWALADRSTTRAARVRVFAVVLADLVLVGLAVVGAAHFRAPALGVLAAVPPVALHAGQGGRDRGLFVGLAALAMAIAAAIIAPSGHALNLLGAVAGAAALVWIAVAVASITEAHRAAETVVRDSAKALAEFRAEIVTTVSHEVRTPLTLIQGLTSTLAHRWPKLREAEKLDLIDTIALNVASLDSSILHFLDASRIARGEFPIEPQTLELADVLHAVERKLSTVLAGHTVHPTLHAPTVWADRDALVRILEHLLSNAVRFSPLGSPIFVRSESSDDGVAISVTDRGLGIPEADLELIWQPLWRADVKESGVSRGAGLGLTIVRQLVEAHGGSSGVTWSSAGKGSTIEVTFPAAVLP
ncbi:MAG: two-component sensor histidine kinase, partial [Acidimicrobiales bacterium]|nr:two-component sensor histidine kinase [Acidimicrobiales bacterium]